MTDKEVIINGVNVAECEFLVDQFSQNTDYCCWHKGTFLKCIKRDCSYKQLQRAKQNNERLQAENEELKKKLERYKLYQEVEEFIAKYSEDKGKPSISYKLFRYKQALEEIETYCTEQLNEHFNHCKYAKGCVNACGISKEVLLKAIIDKIKEVMND